MVSEKDRCLESFLAMFDGFVHFEEKILEQMRIGSKPGRPREELQPIYFQVPRVGNPKQGG